MTVLINEYQLSATYNYVKDPIDNMHYANNLNYKLGLSTNNDNYFDTELNKLVNAGILTKVYDFIENGYREGLYNFADGKGQLSFNGLDHMGLSLSYCY